MEIRRANIDDLPDMLELYAQPSMDDGAALSIDEAAEIFSRAADSSTHMAA